MKDNLSVNIGSRIINVASLTMLQNTKGKYGIDEYIRDFKGTQDELETDLINIALNEMQKIENTHRLTYNSIKRIGLDNDSDNMRSVKIRGSERSRFL